MVMKSNCNRLLTKKDYKFPASMIAVTSYWKTGNRIHKVKVFITTALRMTVPQTKLNSGCNNRVYGAEKRPIIHVKDQLVKVHFSNL